MIRTCLFDMGNVLVYFSHERMCAQMGALCGRTGPEIRELVFDPGHQWDFERGRYSEAEFHRKFVDLVGYETDFDALRHAGSDIFVANEPMLPILEGLKSAGYRLVLLSNTSISHFRFVERNFRFLQLFDEHVVSFRVGAVKPEPAIFDAALAAIHCEPHECFYTDDIPAYVEMGRRYGLDAEIFSGAETLRTHLAERKVALPPE